MNRGDAAAATWKFRGDELRRRRGYDVEIGGEGAARRRFRARPDLGRTSVV